MNSVSFNPSQKSSDGHKSIGRGGSFWLPQKMSSENFETNLKQYSNSTSSKKSFPSKSFSSGGGDRVLNESFKELISQSSVNGSAGKSKPSSMIGVTPNALEKSSPVNLNNAVHVVTAKPFSNTAMPSPFSNKYSSVFTKTLPANISLAAQKSLSHLNSGPPKPEILKKGTFGMMAQKVLLMFLMITYLASYLKRQIMKLHKTNQVHFLSISSRIMLQIFSWTHLYYSLLTKMLSGLQLLWTMGVQFQLGSKISKTLPRCVLSLRMFGYSRICPLNSHPNLFQAVRVNPL